MTDIFVVTIIGHSDFLVNNSAFAHPIGYAFCIIFCPTRSVSQITGRTISHCRQYLHTGRRSDFSAVSMRFCERVLRLSVDSVLWLCLPYSSRNGQLINTVLVVPRRYIFASVDTSVIKYNVSISVHLHYVLKLSINQTTCCLCQRYDEFHFQTYCFILHEVVSHGIPLARTQM